MSMVICPKCGEQNYLSGDKCWACGETMDASLEPLREEAFAESSVTPQPNDGFDPAVTPSPECEPPSPIAMAPEPATPPLLASPGPVVAAPPATSAPAPQKLLQPRPALPPDESLEHLPINSPPLEMPLRSFMTVEQARNARIWARKRPWVIILGVVVLVNVLGNAQGLVLPLLFLAVALAVGFGASRNRRF